MNFQVHYSFQAAQNVIDRTERSGHIVFEAKDRTEALADFRRWWRGRHKILPGNFKRLLAVKASEYTVRPINEADVCMTGHDYHFYEWKIDTLGRGDGPMHFLEPDKEGWR